MSYSKSIAIVFTAVVCSTAIATSAGAQTRGRAPGGGTVAVHAVPRVGPSHVVAGGYRPYYPYHPYYPFRAGISFGFYGGFGYPYFYGYGYPYGYAPYAYGYPYGYPYGYAAPAYSGGVRIVGAPRDAQVFADGNFVGIVDNYDGTFQSLNLQPGVHQIEVRAAGRPPVSVDVNVAPGQTVTYHANVH